MKLRSQEEGLRTCVGRVAVEVRPGVLRGLTRCEHCEDHGSQVSHSRRPERRKASRNPVVLG